VPCPHEDRRFAPGPVCMRRSSVTFVGSLSWRAQLELLANSLAECIRCSPDEVRIESGKLASGWGDGVNVCLLSIQQKGSSQTRMHVSGGWVMGRSTCRLPSVSSSFEAVTCNVRNYMSSAQITGKVKVCATRLASSAANRSIVDCSSS